MAEANKANEIEATLQDPAENNNTSTSRAHEESTGAGSTPFLQDHAYVSIINSRNGDIIKASLKNCRLKVQQKVVENRAHLIQHIANVAAKNQPDMNHVPDEHCSLSPNVIKEIVGCLKESAIEKELRARCAATAGSAEQKKNRLTGILIELYGTPKSPAKNLSQGKKKQKKGSKKGKAKMAKSDRILSEKPEDIIRAHTEGIDQSEAISKTVESIVEHPLKTIEERVLNLDSRITKQESLFNTLLAKMDALLSDPLNNNKELAERFMILEGNDKALFENDKNQNESQSSLTDEMSEKINALSQKVENLHDIVLV